MSSELAKEAADALRVLQQLTTASPAGHGFTAARSTVHTNTMSRTITAAPVGRLEPRHVRYCRGLAFLRTFKAGLVGTLMALRGFLIARRTDAHGSSVWTAPCFVWGSELGFGFSAGLERCWYLQVLHDVYALERFRGASLSTGRDVELHATASKTVGDASDLRMRVGDDAGASVSTFRISSGVMVDASLQNGLVKPDNRRNRSVYGPGVDAAALLEGRVPPPAEFGELYAALQAFAARVDREPADD